jgi:DNA-binding response OmpR family regulator
MPPSDAGGARSDASGSEPATVLAVDDDDDVRVTYELWLDDAWEVGTAADGSEALEKLDDTTDVVILDRMMPGLSGDEVLEEIRERDADCRVVMVTAVNPDFDIVEMPFDGYVPKPVERRELNDTVETLLARSRHDEKLQEYYALVEKRATLEAEKSEQALENDPRYEALTARIREVETELQEDIVELDEEEFVALVEDVL